VNSNFNWQTSCDHLVDATGNAQNSVPYIFVFKVQDDYCPVPKVTYATVTINVENQGVLNAPSIDCITTDTNDDITINWTPINDPNGDFVSYQLHTVNGGVEATIPGVGTNTFTLPGAGNSVEDYFLSVQSGCGGLTSRYSDTLKNIFLTLNNSGNGEAQLIWNNPTSSALNYFGEYYHIYKEYPAGTWSLIDSVPYGSTNYRDTIDVCQAFISYQVTLPTAICDFTSNIEGDVFEDATVPDQPIIYSVDNDTLTGAVTIIWNENNQQDTYGYVIYSEDANGFLVEIDTVWGISSTSYTYFPNTSNGALTHSIAAFDSCFTDVIPPTYQTSAKGEVHTTAFLSGELDVCTRRINLSWSSYAGFDASPEALIWGRLNNGTWQLFGTSSTNEFSLDINLGENYVFAVQYIDLQDLNRFSFSNIVPISFLTAGGPTYSYISVATVSGSEVTIRHRFSQDGGVNRIRLEKYDNTLSSFIEIDEQLADAPEITFIDTEVEVDRKPYTYRTLSLDTCNQIVNISNMGQTMYLTVNTNETQMIHLLQWTPYEDFPGGVREYKIYRGFDGVFDPTPIGITTPQARSWVDTVYNDMENYSGKVCYVIEALEGPNVYGYLEVSQSNVVCPVIPPLVFIPNAFTLGGKNPVFTPITNLHRIDEYQFEIYDRYGRIIFETNEPDMGWDGRIEKTNRYAREGVYIYRLSLRDGNGIEFLKHGHVTLLDYREVND
jgi:gliding motility-associated-like protein